jgi:hypothetical protein
MPRPVLLGGLHEPLYLPFGQCSRASTRAPQIGTQTQLVGHTEEITAAISATGQTTCSDASTVREKLGKLMVGRWMGRIQCMKFLRC